MKFISFLHRTWQFHHAQYVRGTSIQCSKRFVTTKADKIVYKDRLEKQVESISAGDERLLVNRFNTDLHDFLHLDGSSTVMLDRARKIDTFRGGIVEGKFHHLTDILKICESNENDKALSRNGLSAFIKHIRKKIIVPTIYPDLNMHLIKNVRNVVSLDVQQNKVTYINMDSSYGIIGWNILNITQQGKIKRIRFCDIFNLIYKDSVLNLIPNGDIFTYETKPRPTKVYDSFVPVLLYRTMLEYALLSALQLVSDEENINNNNKIFTLDYLGLGKYFNLVVKGERISSQDLVEEMFNTKKVHFNTITDGDAMKDLEDVERELLYCCILQCVFTLDNIHKRKAMQKLKDEIIDKPQT